MAKVPYSIRHGINKNTKGFDLPTTIELFCDAFAELQADGYTHEYFGFFCVDAHYVKGKIFNVEREVLLVLRKQLQLPLDKVLCQKWAEDDLLDMMEFLYDRVSKPLTGQMHNYDNCGMHWETFDAQRGQAHYVKKMNEVLSTYRKPFVMSADGLILRKAPDGLEEIFDAQVPSEDKTILAMMAAATTAYRRHGSSVDERRHAVHDLAHVLEKLRPQMGEVITSKDEADLFNIANNFGIRHQNDKQKTDYEQSVWLSWMFYHYLATIHLILRRLGPGPAGQGAGQ